MTNQEQIKVYYHPVRNELYLIEQNDFFLEAQQGNSFYEVCPFIDGYAKAHGFKKFVFENLIYIGDL